MCMHSLPRKLSVGNFLLFNWEVRTESKVHMSSWCNESLPRKHHPWAYIQKSSPIKVSSDYLVPSLCPLETSVIPFISYPFQPQASIPVLTTIVQKLLTSSLGQSPRLSLPQSMTDTTAHRVKFRLHSMMVQALCDLAPAYSSGLIFLSLTPHPSFWLSVKLAHSVWEDCEIFWKGEKKKKSEWVFCPMHPTGLSLSFLVFELFHFYKL